MSEPSVTKALGGTFVPALQAIGFRRAGAKRLQRISGDLCQRIYIHVENRMRREFMLQYGTILTVVPHTHFPLSLGGGFPVGSRGTWFRADTEERLARSVVAVTEQLPRLLDWFQHTGTIEGYISSYLERWQSEPPAFVTNGHSSFDLACAYLLAGDLRTAQSFISTATDEFKTILAKEPLTRDWAQPGIDRCRELADRVADGTYRLLIDSWRTSTYANLKLSP